NVVQHVARSRELENVTGIFNARRKSVNKALYIPVFDRPIRQSDGRGNSTGMPQPCLDPILIRHKINFVRRISYSDEMNAKRLFVERKRLQTQRLRKRTDIVLAISYRAVRRDLGQFR